MDPNSALDWIEEKVWPWVMLLFLIFGLGYLLTVVCILLLIALGA